jgi:N-acetylneuraminic acid mutarotase
MGLGLLVVFLACEKESPYVPPPTPGPAWEAAPSVQAPREKAGAWAHGGRLYLVGGGPRSDIPEDPLPGVEVFDPDSGRWILHPDLLPTSVEGTVFVPWGDRLFLFSGADPQGAILRTVEVFDPEAMRIMNVGIPLLEGHKDGAGVALGDGILLMGGLGLSGSPTDLMERFDPVGLRTEPAGRMPYPLQDFSAVVFGGRVYVFGGQVGAARTRVDSVAIWDPGTESWEVVDDALPLPWEHPRSVVVGQRLLVLTGRGPAGLLNGIFDPQTRSWSPLSSLPAPRSRCAVTVWQGKVWVISGWTEIQGTEVLTREVLVYDPEADTLAVSGRRVWR